MTFFFLFGSMLSLWDIQHLDPGTSGSLGMGSFLWHEYQVEPVISWSPTSSVLMLPQHIWQGGQIKILRFCGWVCLPVSPLKTLPSCRRWPIQAPYFPLLGVFAGNTLIDPREFPLHQVSISPPKCSSISVEIYCISPSQGNSCVLSLSHPCYLAFLGY